MKRQPLSPYTKVPFIHVRDKNKDAVTSVDKSLLLRIEKLEHEVKSLIKDISFIKYKQARTIVRAYND